MEIVKLIGSDVLPDDQKLIIEITKAIRVGFLQQNAFHKDDTYVPLSKQLKMMRATLHLYDVAAYAVAQGVPLSKITDSGLFDKIVRIKYDVPNDREELLDGYTKEIDDVINTFTIS